LLTFILHAKWFNNPSPIPNRRVGDKLVPRAFPLRVHRPQNIQKLAPNGRIRLPRDLSEGLDQVLHGPMNGKITHEMSLELRISPPAFLHTSSLIHERSGPKNRDERKAHAKRRRHSADKRRLAAKRDLFHPPNQFLPETDKGRKARMPPPIAGTL